MNKSTALVAALLFALTSLSSASAHGVRSGKLRTRTQTTTFRLLVKGRIAPDATFWVAYGPVEGQFGLIQLHSRGSGVYSNTTALPRTGSTVFAYLEGHGTLHTQVGLVPGNPVVTIQRTQPLSLTNLSLPLVTWTGTDG